MPEQIFGNAINVMESFITFHQYRDVLEKKKHAHLVQKSRTNRGGNFGSTHNKTYGKGVKKMKKVYIAGKITGNANYKKEFEKAEGKLKDEGFIVMSPSFMPDGFEQPDYHHVCMAMIDVCDAVYFLPTWVDSRGSHLEMGYAKGKGKEVVFL